MRQPNSRFDSVHDIALVHDNEAGTHRVEMVDTFNFSRVARAPAGEDTMHSMSDMSSAVLQILYWVTTAQGNDSTPQSRLLAVAARVEALL